MGWPVHIVAVGGLVYNNSGEILVAKSVRKNTWSFLGGQVEVGENLEEALNNDVPIDLLEIDIKEICEILGEIIGESYDDKLIDTLFSNFCLGK